MIQTVSNSNLRAIYQGRYKGGMVHGNNGDDKPLCYEQNYWNNDRSTVCWESSEQEVSCKHCRKQLVKLGQVSLKKMTLRERLFSNGN